MFAVIKTGGKQYRVAKDDRLTVEKLVAEPGATVTLDEVLMVGGDQGTTLGAPRVEGASVTATVVEQTRGEKLIVFKKRRRKHSRTKNGHRQQLTVLQVTDIALDGKKPKKAAAKKKAETGENVEADATSGAEAQAE
ncbi:50S ribosomal protein L21 [Algihabitans sp.]|uniref:50S ribosomal protein L21 n=1 Tax=Algihabitans sp. TaxID=2821514 RepID=UPI003BAC10F9